MSGLSLSIPHGCLQVSTMISHHRRNPGVGRVGTIGPPGCREIDPANVLRPVIVEDHSRDLDVSEHRHDGPRLRATEEWRSV